MHYILNYRILRLIIEYFSITGKKVFDTNTFFAKKYSISMYSIKVFDKGTSLLKAIDYVLYLREACRRSRRGTRSKGI